MDKVWVRAAVNTKLHTKVPGVPIRLWGHDFEVQVDGTLCMQMDRAYVKNEVKAGRVRVMESPPVGKDKAMHKKITVIDTTGPKLTMNIGNYYGAGDLNTLIERVSAMRKKESIINFADKRFEDHNLKLSMKLDDIIDKVRSLVDSAYIKFKEGD